MNGRSIGICVAVLALSACDGGGGDRMSSGGGEGGTAVTTGTIGTGGAGANTAGTGAGDPGTGGAGAGATGTGTGTGTGGDFAPESVALCQVINDYRVSLGLPAVPVSPALMTVAETHVADLGAHPEMLTGDCNLHSWSTGSAVWTGCCYTPDHALAQCMWDKPREITASLGNNQYPGNGYEIAESGAGTPEQALELWKGSSGHHNVIINADIWQSFSPWPAVGCGMSGGYGVVWFGDSADPQSP